MRCYQGINPISSTPEAMSLVAFLIAAGFLLASLRYRLAAAGAFAVPAALALLVLARLAPSPAPRRRTMGRSARRTSCSRRWASRCSRSPPCSRSLYLFQDRQLKRKQFDRVMERGTPLDTLDRLAHRCVSIGFPVFTLAIVTGAIWVARLGLLHDPEALRPEYLLAVGDLDRVRASC